MLKLNPIKPFIKIHLKKEFEKLADYFPIIDAALDEYFHGIGDSLELGSLGYSLNINSPLGSNEGFFLYYDYINGSASAMLSLLASMKSKLEIDFMHYGPTAPHGCYDDYHEETQTPVDSQTYLIEFTNIEKFEGNLDVAEAAKFKANFIIHLNDKNENINM